MGAPDFFFAVNATFRHILENYGEEALHRYWEEMGREHYRAVTEAMQERSLVALQEHWEQLFPEEPGSEVETALEDGCLTLTVKTCPAILHLKANDREVLPVYCDHCRYVSQGLCEPAGVRVEVTGGGGSCVQVFRTTQ
jgi:hypothetical protein